MNQAQIMKTVSFTIKEKTERNQENKKTINMCDMTTTIIETELIDKSKQVCTKKTRKRCKTNDMIIHDRLIMSGRNSTSNKFQKFENFNNII